jgi:23S rRNA A1618 N6-methylase RlmF
MKILRFNENKNTVNWYMKTISKDNDKKQFLKFITNILSADIEDFKMIDINNSCQFFVYTTKSEKQKYFKNWLESNLWRVNAATELGTEIEDIDQFLEDLEVEHSANKYNL